MLNNDGIEGLWLLRSGSRWLDTAVSNESIVNLEWVSSYVKELVYYEWRMKKEWRMKCSK